MYKELTGTITRSKVKAINNIFIVPRWLFHGRTASTVMYEVQYTDWFVIVKAGDC